MGSLKQLNDVGVVVDNHVHRKLGWKTVVLADLTLDPPKQVVEGKNRKMVVFSQRLDRNHADRRANKSRGRRSSFVIRVGKGAVPDDHQYMG
jgi:hypothetical protein